MKKAKSIRVLCVDDQPVVREGLAALIATQNDMVSVGEVGDGETAIAQCREHQPDVVVTELSPFLQSSQRAHQCPIRKEFPDMRIIVLTTCEGDEAIHRALEAGAQAYLLKDVARTELLQAIREVQAGQRYISPTVAARLAEHTPRIALTERELQVLNLVAKSLRNKEIGAALNIAEDTVKIHIKNIFSKLNVMHRTQAVVSASKRGIISLDRPPQPERASRTQFT